MKRLYNIFILLLTLSLTGFTTLAQTLTPTGVPPNLCARESFTIGYEFGGAVNAGNSFIAELSNEAGSFISPITIGSIVSTDLIGTIYCTIPDGVTFGTGYVIRVVATNTVFGQVPILSNLIDISCTTRDFYWLGGPGNWSDPTKWEYTTDDITYTPATTPPTQNDNVIFDDTTFPSGGQLTIDGPAYCNDLYWDPISAANNPIFYGESGGNSLNVRGDFVLSPGVYREIWDLFFTSNKANIYLDFGDNQVDNVQNAWWKGFVDFYGGGSWDFGSNLIAENVGIYDGSNIRTNDFTLDIEREIYLPNGAFFAGASDIFAASYGMYSFLDAGTSTFHIRTNRYSWWTHAINGSQTYFNVIIDGELTNIPSDNTYSNLSLINGGGISVWRDTHQMINNSLTATGNGRDQMAQIKTYQQDGGLHTINIGVSATVTADYVAITDSEILGNGTPYAVTNGIDGGNNLNWNISTLAPLAFYWSGGGGNWSDLNHWNTSTDGGTTLVPASEGPGSIDKVYFNANSFPGGGTLTVDQNVNIMSMTWEAGSGDNSPEIFSDYDYDFTVYGDLTMANGVIRNIRRLFLDSNGGTISLNTADNLGNHGDLTFRGGGVINLAGNLENRGWTNFDNATFNSNNFDLDLYAYDFTGSAIVNLGASNVYLDYYWYQNPSALIDFGTSTVIADRENNFPSEIYGTTSFNNFIVREFAMFHEDNSFNNLTIEAGGTLHIQSGRTLSVSNFFNLTGTRSEFATIDAFNGTNGTISVLGTVTADFVDISNNTIIPASSATSGIDGGNNTGWTIGPLPALDFYWIGGTGNWTDPSHWATTDGGSTLHGFAPGPIDNAIFTSNSFPAGGTITIDQAVTINNMTWEAGSGTTNPEISGDWGTRFAITGNITMANNVSRRIRQLVFDSGNGTNLIDLADNFQAEGNLTFEGGGTWDLQSDIIQGNDFYFNSGTLNTNNYALQIGGFWIYDNTTFNFGSSSVRIESRLYNSNNSPVWNDTNATFYFTNTNNTWLRGPFTITNAVVEGVLAFDDNFDNTFVNLTADPGSTIRIFAGSTQTITGVLTLAGSQSSFVTVEAYDYGSPGVGTFDVTGATVSANFTSLSDNTIIPGATANNSIDGGNLTGWTITSPPSQDYYWISGTGNWSDITHWQISADGGSTFTPATGAPGPVDNVIFTTASFPAGGTITIDQPVTITNMTWQDGSGQNNPEMFGSWENTLTIRGDLIMAAGVRRRAYTMIFDSSSGTNNITMADNYDAYGDIRFLGGGQWNMLDSLYCGASLFVEEGTLNTNNHPLTVRFGFRTESNLATVNFGASNVYLYDGIDNGVGSNNLNMGTSVFYFGNPWNGDQYMYGSTTFNEVVLNNKLRIYADNTFNSLSVNPGGSILITAGSTQTVTGLLNIQGSRSTLAEINIFDGSANGIFEVTGATVMADYVAIGNNTITVASSATNAVDDGNNSGWTLTPLSALDMYWIGGSGNWTDPAHWSYTDGGEANVDGFAPGVLDNAIFTSNSFEQIGRVTIDQPVTINNVTWQSGSGAFNPEIYGDYNNTLTILGDLTMADGVQRKVYGLRIDSRNATNQVFLADNYNAEGDIRFTGGGESNLNSALRTLNYLVVEGATLNTLDNTIEVGGLNFEGQTSILNLGASDVTIYDRFGVYANNPVLNTTTSTITFTTRENSGNYFSRIENYSLPINFNNVVISNDFEFFGNNTFNSLVVGAGNTVRLFAGDTQTITNSGSLAIQGSRSGLVTIESWDYGSPGRGIFSASGATITADFVRIKDNIIDNGLGTNVLATNAVDLGNNIGWDYQAVASLNYYWVGGPGNWTDISHWEIDPQDGTAFLPATDPPGAVDNVFFTTNSFPDGGSLTFDVIPEVVDMIWEPGSGANFPVLFGDWPNNEMIIHGSLQLAEGVYRNFYRLNFDSDDAGNTISLADNQYNWQDIDFNGTGEWTLLDSMATSYLNLRGGTLNTGGNPISIDQQMYLDWQHDGTVNWGASNVYLRYLYNDAQNLTFNAQTSTFNFKREDNELNGLPLSFNRVEFAGNNRLNNSYNFNEVSLEAGTSLRLQAGSTQTIVSSFTGIGNRGQMIQIYSSNTGNTANIIIDALGGATFDIQYAIVQDNILDNGDGDPLTQQVAVSSVDNGGNQGWDFSSIPLDPLDYYWVGGTGNWSDITHWVTEDGGATPHLAPPGVIDNVFFTANSFPESGTLTLDQPAACNDMTWSDGSFSPTIYGNYENRLTIRGNLSIARGVNRNLEYIEFNSDTDNLLILGDNRYDGYSEFIFRGSGSWSLIDSLSVTNIQVFSGTLNTLDNPLNISWDFNLHSEGAIGLNFGSSDIRLSNINNWANNVTANVGTSTISILDGGSFGGDDMEFYNVNIEGQAWIYPTLSITNDLTIQPGGILELSPDNTLTVGNLNAVGTRPQPVTIRSWDQGRQATLSSAGTINASDIVIRDNNAIGGATFNALEAVDRGNNAGWIFSPITALNFYWTGGSGDWSDITHWSISDDGGTTFNPASFAPGAVDNVFVDAILTGSSTINLDYPAECNNMTWSSGLAGSAISGSFETPFTVHGSLTLSPGVSTELEQLIFDSENSGNTINLADNSGNQFMSTIFRGAGNWSLADSLSSYQISMEGGALNTAGQSINTEYLYLYGQSTTLNLASSKAYVRIFDGDPNNVSFVPGTSTVYFEDDAVIYNSWTFNDIIIDGEVRIRDDNTINELTLEPGSTLILGQQDTITVTSLNATGSRPRPITIKSDEAGVQSTIIQQSGSVNGNYLTLQDNNASGGAFFIAQNSIDNGNNDGWTIIQTTAKEYWWVGGSGNWSDASSHWTNTDGGEPSALLDPPGPLDKVNFTANSFPDGGTLTLDFPVSVNDMDWTGSTSQVSITDNGDFENSLTVGGDFILANGVSRDFLDLYLVSNNPGNTIYTADNLSSINYINFQGSGEWNLAGALNTYGIYLEGGTFNTNDNNVDATLIYLFGNNISNWGTSQVTTRRFYQFLDNGSNFKSGNSTFQFNEQTIVRGDNRFFNVQVNADATFRDSNIIINGEVHNGTLEVLQNQAFSNLVITDGATMSLAPGTVQTVNLGLNIIGSVDAPITINSTEEGTTGSFQMPSSGSVNATYAHLKDNTATGGATFNTTNSSDFGNVSGWLGLLSGQTIDFGPLSDQPLNSGSFSVGASSSSGLSVNFEIASGNASISGSTVTPTTSGLIGVRAVQQGDVDYGSAKPVTQFIHIDATDQPEEIGNMKEARITIGQSTPFVNGEFYNQTTVPRPWASAVSSTGKLAIANGTRVMIWDQIPGSFDVPADVVVGQTDFTTDNNPTISASSFSGQVYSVSFTRDDKMVVTDERGVLIFNTIPTSNGASANVIVGQTNFTATRSGTAADRFADGLVTATIYFDEVSSTESLIVTDYGNSRVLIYNTLPTANGASANFVIGQTDFNSKANGAAADKLDNPVSSTAKDGQLFIADYGNNRVLVFNSLPTSNGASADYVLGQPGFGFNEGGTTATLFRGPTAVAVSRTGKLAVADYSNNRVLIYNAVPGSNTTAPDIILGQPHSESMDDNYNTISGRTMYQPIEVSWDISNNLFVADNGNNRVMLYGAPDLEGPVIESSTIPSFHEVGSGTLGSLTISDRSGVVANIHYKGISSAAAADPHAVLPLVDNGSGTFNFNTNDLINAGEQLGIEFGLEIVDGYGNTSPITMQTIPLRYAAGLAISNLGVGSNTENYKMFSIPLDLNNKGVNTVFDEIISGGYNANTLRVYSYPGGPAANYSELSSGQNLEIGKGYFALAANAASVNSGAGTTASVSAASPFETTLVPGWNMIGNPYNFTVNWSDVLNESAIGGSQPGTPQGYNGGWADQASLIAGVGYFVNNPNTSNVVLKFPVENKAGGRNSGIILNTNPLTAETWEVRFLEKNVHGEDLVVGAVGMDPYALASFDEMDQINPPPFGEQATIEFSHPEFFQPSFKKDYRESSYEQQWNSTYRAPIVEEGRQIYWDNSYYGEASPDIYLVDKSNFKVVNMKEENSYSFPHNGATEFEVFYGFDALEQIYPDNLVTITPYPNPFTQEVRINIGLPDLAADSKVNVVIFDNMGRQVATLDEYTNNRAYMEFIWKGTNDSGNEVPRGIYAFRVLIDGNLDQSTVGKVIKE